MKTILITGSTDGIGLVTARQLLGQGHRVLIHGRNAEKLAQVKERLAPVAEEGMLTSYMADLTSIAQTVAMAEEIAMDFDHLDVIINNAGVFRVSSTLTEDGLDVRFMVNTIAPYILTTKLLPLLGKGSRVVNLSSAAQASFNHEELLSLNLGDDSEVYAKSKLALTTWTFAMAAQQAKNDLIFIAVNPKSFLGSKMVQEAYGVQGASLSIGADILVAAALSEKFATANGKYFDNDIQAFTRPHPQALDKGAQQAILETLNSIISKKSQ